MSGTEPGQFGPLHESNVGIQNRIQFCDHANRRIQFFNPELPFLHTWDDGNSHCDVYCNQEGLIYAAVQYGGGAVSIFSEDVERICRFRMKESGLRGVQYVRKDSRNNLFVSELRNRGHCALQYARIRRNSRLALGFSLRELDLPRGFRA